MKVLFASVIYKSVLKYFDEFYNSIMNQTYKNFDIFFLNDNLSRNEIENLNLENNITIKDKKSKYISSSRVELIDYAMKENYDLLILGDSDDYFHKDRIQRIVDNYSDDYAFFYHDLLKENGEKYFIKELPRKVNRIDQIEQYNFLGLSMSALNLKKIEEINFGIIDKNINVIAFDWYLYSVLIILGCMGKYVEDAFTYYREYDENFARNDNTIERINMEYKVKKEHYKNLIKFNMRFLKLYQKLDELDLNMVNINSDNNYWWNKLIIDC